MKKKKPLTDSQSQELCHSIVRGMQEKKAERIVVIDLRNKKEAIANFYVIATGNSGNQIEAIADSIETEVFKERQENPWHVEGKNNKEWMLLDYADVVAHVFRKDRRDFYGLEELWGDAIQTIIEEGKTEIE